MALHHQSSASFSSLSLSRTSNTSSSSSQSSPTSSLDSATESSPAPPTASASPRQRAPTLSSTLIPFSWEEKPGVLKKEITGASHPHERCGGSSTTPFSLHRDVNGDPQDAEYAYKAARIATPKSSASRETSYAPPRLLEASSCCQKSPYIRLPPCPLYPELQSGSVGGSEFTSPPPMSCRNHHYHSSGFSASAVGSKLIASLSLHKRRHHRRSSSLEDDPFWLAMIACTNDGDDAPVATQHKGRHDAPFGHKVSEADSWLARRVVDRVQLDRCMPRNGASSNQTIARRGQIDRSQYKATNNSIRSGTSKASKSGISNSASTTRSHTHPHIANGGKFETVRPDQSRNGALKSFSRAKSQLQGGSESFLQRQAPPVVDVSCSSNRATMAKVRQASKHKLPDRLGSRKSTHLTSMTSLS